MNPPAENPSAKPASIETSKLGVLRLIGWLLVAGPLVFLALLYFFLPAQPQQAVGPLLILFLASLCLFLIHRNQAMAAALLLVYCGSTAIAVHAFVSGAGIYTPQLAALPLEIMLAGWLLGRGHAIAVTAFSVAFTLVLALLDQSGLAPSVLHLPPVFVWLPRAIVAVGVCLLTLYIVHTYEERIGEVRRLGEALAEERTQLRAIAENVPALIFHGDRDMRCLFANRQFADFFHGGGAPLEGMHLREILGDAVFEAALPNVSRALAGESVLLAGERLSKSSGQRHLEISLVPQCGDQGQVIGFYALKRDITERLRTKQALAESEAQLRLVAENVPAMIAYNDSEMVLRYANRRYMDFFGLDSAAVIGQPIRDIIGEMAFREAEPLLLRALAGQPVSYRGMRRTASGQERIIAVESVPDFGADGEVRGAYALMRDITDRQRAEEALQIGQARLAEAQRIGRFGSWDLDLVSKRLHWTEELFNIYECDPATFGGTWDALLEMVHPDDLDVIRAAFRKSADAGRAYEVDHRILTPGGHTKHLHVRWEVFLDAEGKPVRALGTAQDITEQTLAKAEIQRLNDELESRVRERTAELQAANKELESFAYSISHDLRAPLRGIDGFSHLLAEEYNDRLDEQGRGYLDRVRRAAQRMGMLIDDILELSRVTRQEMRRVRVDLSKIAAELIDECSRAEPQRRVDVSLAAGCSAVGDPQLLRVMMQNLFENAWKYTGKTEKACIDFFCERIDGVTVFQVRDNGVGFDMQYAGRLFSPFQRLHSPEEFEGTGIGLATVARVAHRHGGRAWAESAPGEGATFRFTLG